jgi:hypothetical protein
MIEGGFPFTCVLSKKDDKTGTLAVRGFFGKSTSTGRTCIVSECPAPSPAPAKTSMSFSFGKGRKLQTLGKVSVSMPAAPPTAACFKVCQPKPMPKSMPVISFGKGK